MVQRKYAGREKEGGRVKGRYEDRIFDEYEQCWYCDTQTHEKLVIVQRAVITGYFNYQWLVFQTPLVTKKAGVKLENIREHRNLFHYFLLWISKDPKEKLEQAREDSAVSEIQVKHLNR